MWCLPLIARKKSCPTQHSSGYRRPERISIVELCRDCERRYVILGELSDRKDLGRWGKVVAVTEPRPRLLDFILGNSRTRPASRLGIKLTVHLDSSGRTARLSMTVSCMSKNRLRLDLLDGRASGRNSKWMPISAAIGGVRLIQIMRITLLTNGKLESV